MTVDLAVSVTITGNVSGLAHSGALRERDIGIVRRAAWGGGAGAEIRNCEGAKVPP